MEAINQQLDSLSVSEISKDELDQFKATVSAFLGEKRLEDASATLQELTRTTKDKKCSAALYGMLLHDSDQFVRAVAKLGGTSHVFLVNLLGMNNAGAETLSSVLHSLKSILNETTIHAKSLLLCYYSVLSNFECHNYSHLHVLMKYMNPLRDSAGDLTPVVLLIVVKYLELDRTQTIEILQEYLESFDEGDLSVDQFLNFTKVLEVLFSVVPEIAEPIYLSENTKSNILQKTSEILQNNSSSTGLPLSLYPNQKLVIVGILKLLNSSCVSEQSRTHGAKVYIDLLRTGAQVKANNQTNTEIKLLSSLTIIKLWNFVTLNKDQENAAISIENLCGNMVQFAKESNNSNQNATESSSTAFLDYCIEGLAYLSLNNTVKKNLRNDEDLISLFVKLLSSPQSSSLYYGLLVVIVNLAKLKDTNADTQDKQTLNYLKSMSTPKTGKSQEQNEKDQVAIHLFNKSLLVNYKIVSVVSKLKVYQQDSRENNLLDMFITLIYMIALNQDKVVKLELVKQGALNVVLNYLVKTSTVDNKTGRTIPISTANGDTRMSALRSLAKILINVNPTLAFNKYDPKSSLPFLVELLGPDLLNYKSSLNNDTYLHDMTLLDNFESLLALTNLSTMESKELKKLIISRTFDAHLNNFIIDNTNGKVQQAAWQLIANLITEPALSVKFFNVEKDENKANRENYKRLILLVKLLNSRDDSLQITLANVLVNATSEYDMISQILMSTVKDELIEIIVEIFEKQTSNEDLVLRVSYLLLNLVYGGLESDLSDLSNNVELKQAISSVLKASNPEIREILIEVIKAVRFN